MTNTRSDSQHGLEEVRERLYEHYASQHVNSSQNEWLLERTRAQNGYRSAILPHLPPDRHSQVLELACGNGALLELLASEGFPNALGVDISPEQIAVAQTFGVDGAIHADLFTFLNSCASRYDVILAIDLIEHLTKPELMRLISLAHAHLEPNGRLIVQSSNSASPFGSKRRYDDFTHETSFTSKSISQILRACQFTDIAVYPARPGRHSLLSSTRRILWQVVELPVRGLLFLESGEWYRGPLTQNLVAVGVKPSKVAFSQTTPNQKV